MLGRCYKPKTDSYKYYGGKGVEVCDEWRQDFRVFKEWILENGWVPGKDLSIERLDVNGNYCPENCIVADRITQAYNKTTTRREFVDGKLMNRLEIAKKYNLSLKDLIYCSRPKSGRSFQEAVDYMRSVESPILYPKKIECNGESHTFSRWAKIIGVSRNVLQRRLDQGFSFEDAINKLKWTRRNPSKGKIRRYDLMIRQNGQWSVYVS